MECVARSIQTLNGVAMFIFNAILLSLFSASSFAADLPVKVYSASELQKLSDSVYRSLNNRGQDENAVELLQNKLSNQPDHSKALQQIENALSADNSNSLRQIYRAASSASSGKIDTAPVQTVSGNIPAKINEKQVDNNQNMALSKPSIPERRANKRLDAWLERQSGDLDLPQQTTNPDTSPLMTMPAPEPQSATDDNAMSGAPSIESASQNAPLMTMPTPEPLPADVAASVLSPLTSQP